MIGFLLQVAIIAVGLTASFYLFCTKPYLKMEINKSKKQKKLSVIIPCRNEEKNIKLLLEDLKNQTVKPFEIIVVNDNSTDSTLSVAKSFDVKVVDIKEKDKEYLGKSWAVQTGAKSADGNLFLFLDADVRLGKNAIKLLLCQKEIEQNKVITVQPYHKTQSLYEQFSLPFNIIQMAANEATTKNPNPIGLYGPVILISKEVYTKIGGHYHVRQSIIEDVSLGIHLKNNGYKFNAYIGKPEISFRMYSDGFKSLLQGWTKNIAFGAAKSSWKIALLTFLLVGSVLGSFTGMLTYLIKGQHFFSLVFFAFYTVWSVRLFCISRHFGKFKKITFAFHPVVFFGFVLIFAISMLKKLLHIPVKWKGRLIG